MEPRTNWVIVGVSGAFALGIIVLAVATAYTANSTQNSAPLAAAQGESLTPEGSVGDWRTALDAIATAATKDTGEFRAPAELGATPSIAQELVATYYKLKSENKLNTPEADDALNSLIKRNVKAIEPNDTYTLGAIRTNPAVTLDAYAGVVGTTMEQSASVQEYELVTFARTVGHENHNGTPELQAAARIYHSIETDLAATQVPPALATQHLAVIKSIAYLAQATELLGGWSGDPIDALAYVDAFVRAEHQSQTAFNALFSAMINVGKKS